MLRRVAKPPRLRVALQPGQSGASERAAGSSCIGLGYGPCTGTAAGARSRGIGTARAPSEPVVSVRPMEAEDSAAQAQRAPIGPSLRGISTRHPLDWGVRREGGCGWLGLVVSHDAVVGGFGGSRGWWGVCCGPWAGYPAQLRDLILMFRDPDLRVCGISGEAQEALSSHENGRVLLRPATPRKVSRQLGCQGSFVFEDQWRNQREGINA